MLRRGDWRWLLALPVYQTVSTFRHEGAHALMAMAQGARITEFVFWPTVEQKRGILWGHVSFDGHTTWLMSAAPYLCDLATALLLLAVWVWARRLPRWVWLNLVILFLISPFIDSAYNYVGGTFRPHNDVAKLMRALPDLWVHLYFAVSLAFYGIATFVALRRR